LVANVTWQQLDSADHHGMTDREPRLANRLRGARMERNLSQTDLARAVGVSRQTISSIETGRFGLSTLLALRLARYLERSVEDLFSIEGAAP
jgi:putative transcriptional regulator